MDSANLITIFTPCYNRAHLLSQLYKSILAQQVTNFEWLIVDDGSSDNTKEVVEGFISENKIVISYHHKSNGGKHTAVNYGVQKAKGNLFCIVDSDDLLTNDALVFINIAWQKIKENPKVCGIIGLSKFTNGEIVGDAFLVKDWQIPFSDYYLKYHLKGDKSVAFKTAILKQYPFPELEEIKMVFEAVVWHEISKKYDVICLNEAIQNVNYQQQGLSDSSYKLWYIKSLAFSYFQLIANKTYSFSRYPKDYLWSFIHLAINSLLSETSYFDKLPTIKDKCLYLILFPRAYYSYRKMKHLIVK
jgi:glycosyltransferase involved in cell wall biosynthesis